MGGLGEVAEVGGRRYVLISEGPLLQFSLLCSDIGLQICCFIISHLFLFGVSVFFVGNFINPLKTE